MEGTIETRLKESLSLAEKKFKGDTIFQKFEKSNNEFKELVSKGMARERGHNLLSPSDSKSLSKVAFNAK